MRNLLSARFRSTLDRGIAALVWTALPVAMAVTGLALLLAAATTGLAQLIGPILAMAIVGAGLVACAALVALWRRRKAGPALPVMFLSGNGTRMTSAHALGQVSFVLGFVLARTVIRRLRG